MYDINYIYITYILYVHICAHVYIHTYIHIQHIHLTDMTYVYILCTFTFTSLDATSLDTLALLIGSMVLNELRRGPRTLDRDLHSLPLPLHMRK